VDANGKSTHLRSADFTLQPAGEIWTSPLTGARYPTHWRVSIPKLGIDLEVKTPLESQELSGKTTFIPNYWEGAIVLSGRRNRQPLRGVGYLEMTGYDRPVQLAK
jgi:predicted secreted hydrolase